MKYKVDSILFFSSSKSGDVGDLWPCPDFDFYVMVERINKMYSLGGNRWRGGERGQESDKGKSFCQIFIGCWEKAFCLASSALLRQGGSKRGK